MRSVAGKVSNAWEGGATSKTSLLCGADPWPALPKSEKSFSTIVVASDGVQPNIRRCHASELVKVRTAWGTRYPNGS